MRDVAPDSVIWASAASDVGAVRSRNEDGLWLIDHFRRDGAETVVSQPHDLLFVAVADGVGGAAAGDMASRFVLENFAARLSGDPSDAGVVQWLKGIAEAVNRTLVVKGFHSGNTGMATTMTGIVLLADHVFWINAGDSRLYSFTEGALKQVSRDHTLRELMADPSIPGNIITNCFGTEDEFYLDVEELVSFSGSTFLLCSDGLSDYANHQTLEALLFQADSAATIGEFGDVPGQLVAAALKGGGGDNITCLVLRASPR